jgi:hypothetical protein
MIISHKHKFIFLHTERTGGTSIAKALIPHLGPKDEVYGYTHEGEILSDKNRTLNLKGGSGKRQEQGVAPWKHSTAYWVKKYVGNRKWKAYFKFAFIRSPWDIYLSLFHHWKNSKGKWDPIPKGFPEKYNKIKKMSFDEYLCSNLKWEYTLLDYLILEKKEPSRIDPFASGTSSQDIGIDLDFVGRYEKLRLDFSYLCGRLDLPNLFLWRNNESRTLEDRRHFSSYIKNEKSRSEIIKKHGVDLNYFKYPYDYNEYEDSWNHYMM